MNSNNTINKGTGKLSKNQTQLERAALAALEGNRVTAHFCESPNCPRKSERILLKELQPVMQVRRKQRTVFYHRSCFASL